MRLNFYIILLFLFIEKVVAQPFIEVNYDFYLKGEEINKKMLKVVNDINSSLCKQSAFTQMMNRKTGEIYLQKDTSFVFVDFRNNSIISQDRTAKERVLVKDSFHLFNWKLTSKTKEVLGYKCQEAISYFRGRNYIAYFTSELSFKAGPWKFNGLPGVILEVYSENKGVIMKATSLKVNNEGDIIKLPVLPYKAVSSWNEFIIKYKKDLKMKQQE